MFVLLFGKTSKLFLGIIIWVKKQKSLVMSLHKEKCVATQLWSEYI